MFKEPANITENPSMLNNSSIPVTQDKQSNEETELL